MNSLEKINDHHYRSPDGYFLFRPDTRANCWVFIPFEKEFDSDKLLSIFNTLKQLESEK